MALKWIVKAFVSSVLAFVILLYPEKAAALAALAYHTVWNVAVMIGEQVHVPGESKAKAAATALLFVPFGAPTL